MKITNSSHNSPSEWITSVQEFITLLGFFDTNGMFSDTCWGANSFFWRLFRLCLLFQSLFLFYVLMCVMTFRDHYYNPNSPFHSLGRDWWTWPIGRGFLKCSFIVSRSLPLYKLALRPFFWFLFSSFCHFCHCLIVALTLDLLLPLPPYILVSLLLPFFHFLRCCHGKEKGFR